VADDQRRFAQAYRLWSLPKDAIDRTLLFALVLAQIRPFYLKFTRKQPAKLRVHNFVSVSSPVKNKTPPTTMSVWLVLLN
jgi:hypothetical protein